jgi:hypothetical protein
MVKTEIINGEVVKLRKVSLYKPPSKSARKEIKDYHDMNAEKLPEEKKTRKHNPRTDDRLRRSIAGLAKMGLTMDEIADTLGVSKRWLQLNHKHDIQYGRQIANALVVENLYQQAMKDQPSSIQAGIYLTKARMGWRDKDEDSANRPPPVIFDFSSLSYEERMNMLEKMSHSTGATVIEGDVVDVEQE